MVSLFLSPLRLGQQTLKVQLNEGDGAAFPLHWDSSSDLATSDGRIVTAIVYLNQNWREDQGGQLRLYPFPHPPIDIEPLAGRMVLFTSKTMLHRVLPSTADQRLCFSIWLGESKPSALHARQRLPPSELLRQIRAYGRSQDSSSEVEGQIYNSNNMVTPLGEEQLVDLLLGHSPLRERSLKVLYHQEWERSLYESHSPGPALDAAIERHRKDVQRIQNALGGGLEWLLQETQHNEAFTKIAHKSTKWL